MFEYLLSNLYQQIVKQYKPFVGSYFKKSSRRE